MYPVSFEMDFVERRSRLTTFLRLILAIPHLIFASVYGLVFYVVWIVAWFVLLFTGRWPQSLYNFTCGFLRYVSRLSAYLYLGVDQYPPFNGADNDSYPVRVQIAPALERYSRVKVLFLVLYALVAYVIRYAMGIVLSFVSLVSWVVIVITGRQPEALQDALNFSLAYTVRADALMFMLVQTYPPFGSGQQVTVAHS